MNIHLKDIFLYKILFKLYLFSTSKIRCITVRNITDLRGDDLLFTVCLRRIEPFKNKYLKFSFDLTRRQ